MAPNEKRVVEWQTSEIMKCLLEEEGDVQCRQFTHDIEADGPSGADDDFDPTPIADKLKCIADSMNDDITFQAALKDFKKAAAQETVEAAFIHGLDALDAQVARCAEVTSELQLIKATVAFGLFAVKSYPGLRVMVNHTTTAFLNRHVGDWVVQQGGWGSVNL